VASGAGAISRLPRAKLAASAKKAGGDQSNAIDGPAALAYEENVG
jgi:hypothetical protein